VFIAVASQLITDAIRTHHVLDRIACTVEAAPAATSLVVVATSHHGSDIFADHLYALLKDQLEDGTAARIAVAQTCAPVTTARDAEQLPVPAVVVVEEQPATGEFKVTLYRNGARVSSGSYPKDEAAKPASLAHNLVTVVLEAWKERAALKATVTEAEAADVVKSPLFAAAEESCRVKMAAAEVLRRSERAVAYLGEVAKSTTCSNGVRLAAEGYLGELEAVTCEAHCQTAIEHLSHVAFDDTFKSEQTHMWVKYSIRLMAIPGGLGGPRRTQLLSRIRQVIFDDDTSFGREMLVPLQRLSSYQLDERPGPSMIGVAPSAALSVDPPPAPALAPSVAGPSFEESLARLRAALHPIPPH
jgi:hypothetical protein